MTIFDILPWWGWALSTFGVVGIIAFIILAPALAQMVFSFVLGRLAVAMRTPLGAGVIVGMACLIAGYFYGGFRSEQLCNTRIEKMRADSIAGARDQDSRIRTEIEGKYAPIVKALEQQSGAIDKVVTDYEAKLKAAGDAGKCMLGPEPLRLRQRP